MKGVYESSERRHQVLQIIFTLLSVSLIGAKAHRHIRACVFKNLRFNKVSFPYFSLVLQTPNMKNRFHSVEAAKLILWLNMT